MSTPTLHRFALVSLVGTSYKTRMVCTATGPHAARLAFQEARKAKGMTYWDIPDGWLIRDRGPVPVTLETLAQEVGNTPLREMDAPTQQTILALAAIPGKNTKPEPAPVEPRPFQVGDKVKRNGRCAIGMVGKDTVGRVEKVDPLGGVAVAFDGVKAPIIFTQPHHFIELVEAAPEPRTFQPGDTVKHRDLGCTGKVQDVSAKGVEVWWANRGGTWGTYKPEQLELIEAAPVTKDPAAYIQELETELSQVKAHADLTREQLDSLRRERAKAEEILASREITGVTLDARILNLLDKHREHDRINSLAIDQLKQAVVDREADLGVARDMVQEILAIETLRHLAPERLALADGALSEDVQARLRDLLAALAPRV